MPRRKADSKHIEVNDDRAEKRRVQLERDRFEWEREKQIYTAASAATGTYLMVRTVQNAVDFGTSVGPPSLIEAFRALLGQDDARVSESAKKFLRADPLALSFSLFVAGLVFSGFDPSQIMQAVAEAALPV